MPTGPRLLDTVTLSEVIKGRDPEVLLRAREYLSAYGRLRLAWLTVMLAGFVLAVPGCRSAAPSARIERIADDTISFPAVVTAGRFERRVLGMPGYHFIVWDDGRAATAALFQAAVSDVQVIEALEELGAQPGNALGMDTWNQRDDPHAKAPEKIIQGPPVDALVRIPGRREPLTIEEILLDPEGRGFEMRFGGHRANIPAWHSGCIVCLYSCPGSKVGNARYTVRDYTREPDRFRVRPGVLPEDGTEVTVLLRLRKQGES